MRRMNRQTPPLRSEEQLAQQLQFNQARAMQAVRLQESNYSLPLVAVCLPGEPAALGDLCWDGDQTPGKPALPSGVLERHGIGRGEEGHD